VWLPQVDIYNCVQCNRITVYSYGNYVVAVLLNFRLGVCLQHIQFVFLTVHSGISSEIHVITRNSMLNTVHWLTGSCAVFGYQT